MKSRQSSFWLKVLLCSLFFSGQFLLSGILLPEATAENFALSYHIINKDSINGIKGDSDTIVSKQDSILDKGKIPFTKAIDSIPIRTDSITKSVDSLANLSNNTSKEKPIVLEDKMHFTAEDSVVVHGQNEVLLFGKGNVDYKEADLKANFMKMQIDSSQVYAQYVLDSLGRPSHYPIFSDGKQTVETGSVLYNYDTEKGFVTDMLTRQGEGYLTGDKGKVLADKTMFLQGGNFTTCDHIHSPHFQLHMTRAKVTADKNIVTGPVYLVMGGVPLYPIGLPFGFFPFNEHRTSGIIFPSYGEEQNKGFYLRGFGFYYAINDYVDVTVRGDLYTLGSWAVHGESTYRRRYKYSGSASVSFVNTQYGDKSIPGDYSSTKDFSVRWSHTQDAKVDPLRTFSASVNFSTSSYNHNALEAIYNPDQRAQNTKGSSISYSRRFTSIPLSLTSAFTIDQRSRDSTISVTLPNVSISLRTIYPFKRKKALGKERWYEKISISYTGNIRNSITTKENLILKSNLIRDWNNSFTHSIPISASFDLFNYIKVTPSFNYNARWNTRRIYKEWSPAENRIINSDTVYRFNHINDFSTSVSFSTTLYGFYQPIEAIFGNFVQMIRHRMTPSISFSYQPDFGSSFWGYYKTIHYTDAQGKEEEYIYSPLEGAPGRGKRGIVSFNVGNNLEMKLRNFADTTGTGGKKVSLIDQFDWRVSYNMAADSFQWSNIGASLSLRFSPRFNLRLSGDFDTYLYDYTLDNQGRPIPRRINKLRITGGKGFGRLISTGTGFSYTFNNQSIEKIKEEYYKLFPKKEKDQEELAAAEKKEKDNPNKSKEDMPSFGEGKKFPTVGPGGGLPSRGNYNRPEDMGELDDDGYVKWNFPWSFSVNYSMNVGYNYQDFNIKTKEYNYALRHNLSFRGDIQPTQNWRISFDANYNVELKRLTSMTLSVNRKLHCWDLTASIIPIGPYKSYNLTIGVSADMLKDLKYQQSNLGTGGRKSWF